LGNLVILTHTFLSCRGKGQPNNKDISHLLLDPKLLVFRCIPCKVRRQKWVEQSEIIVKRCLINNFVGFIVVKLIINYKSLENHLFIAFKSTKRADAKVFLIASPKRQS